MMLTGTELATNIKIENEGLQFKHDTQIVIMRDSHAEKLLRVVPDLDKALNFPDAIRWEVKEVGGLTDAEIEQEVQDQQAYYQWKHNRLTEVVSLIDTEIALRSEGKVDRKPIGTTYYIDSIGGNDANDGLSTGAAWATLDKFTENARSAGDKAILRRGLGTDYDNGTDLLFTSDGTIDNPIIVTADNDNAFSDDVDLSATATATLTFGSKTITFASDISGVLAAGDWIYVSAEDADEFAYEVAAVSTVTVTLFLPYKGAQAGSGKTMTNMQSPPIWGTAAASFQVNLDTDHFWMFQGVHFRGTDTNGVVEVDGSASPMFKDCIIEANGASDRGIRFTDDWPYTIILKCRFYNCRQSIATLGSAGGFTGIARDCLMDGVNAGASAGLQVTGGVNALLVDCELKNHALGDISFTANSVDVGVARLRNCILSSTTEADLIDASLSGRLFIEDHDGVLNDTRQLNYLSSTEATPTIQSETGTVRSGGGTISIKCTPSTDVSSVWEHSRIKLFEYGFYATTDEKTYTVYFRPDATTEWTADPTALELWIELEYWGHASNNFRRILKSTSVINMNGSIAWQTLTVTVAPSQAGVAYLRCYYAKMKESGKNNIFYCDTQIGVT